MRRRVSSGRNGCWWEGSLQRTSQTNDPFQGCMEGDEVRTVFFEETQEYTSTDNIDNSDV